MRGVPLILFISSSLTFFACSQQNESRTTKAHFPDREQALKVLQGDQVQCEGKSCPESVGALYIMHSIKRVGEYRIEFNMGLCSATLISPSHILTNRHCLEGIIGEGESCKEGWVEMSVKFPASQGVSFEAAKCKKVVQMSAKYSRSLVPDWAVIELDRDLNRKPAVTDSLAFNDEIQVQAPQVMLYPVYFDGNYASSSGNKVNVGIIKAVECSLNLNDNFNIFSFTGDNPMFQVSGCSSPLQKGNSGTGLFLKDNGQMLGLMAFGSLAGGKNKADGTMATCIPFLHEKNPTRSCFFSEDDSYIQVAKTTSFASSAYRQSVLPLLEVFPANNYKSYRWPTDTLPLLQRLQGVNKEFNSPWNTFSTYLEQQNVSRLKRQFEGAILRVYFAKLPGCVMENSIQPNMELPLVDINWFLIQASKNGNQTVSDWYEEKKADGSFETHVREWRNFKAQILPVMTKATKNQIDVTFEGELLNPKGPLKKFSLKIPICPASVQ